MPIHQKVADLQKSRAKAMEELEALALADGTTPDDFETKKKAVTDIDATIARVKQAQELAASTAQPAAGQSLVPAAAESDPYVKEKSLMLGGIAKMMGMGVGNIDLAVKAAERTYGESHPITKALIVSTGSAGGFIVPPDVMNEVIPLLRAQAVVRAAGPRNLAMPRGTMTLPGQASAATATYGSEVRAITKSQQSLNQIVASYKKLTALVPVSNDMMRYADPSVDAFVRDDLVKVMALREDLAFITGDGTQDTPRGYLSFANAFGTTPGVFLSTGNSTAAAGGNWITSTSTYTLATVAAELGGAVNKLDTANVPDSKRCWFMHPRSWNYLNNVQNSLGVYVYRDELSRGTLLGYPFKKTTQVPVNLYNADGSQTDCSFVFLVEMTEDIILDSMQLELAVFREGSYVDENGATISAVQNDQTIIRAIAEHDHQMRHDAAVAVIQFVRWAPAIS
ncbi:phage major capsid protein [Rhizobium sp. N324]|uniref:phage major capsid protein n=1 Tax=Rhizobium sp. N324 TaxID=1703969 RepID=UPI0007EC2A67|nr:phage major capsid protein [Rhizobium sp. N324]ANM12055.1 HK97 family phage major capsid protein [Rhizobium sp. N324]